jgi:hypothetical protein
MPEGESSCRRLKSRINRRREGVLILLSLSLLAFFFSSFFLSGFDLSIEFVLFWIFNFSSLAKNCRKIVRVSNYRLH